MICRGCDSAKLQTVVDLGLSPLANNLCETKATAKNAEKFPLALALCDKCKLVQLTHTVPPEKMFSHYLYFSSYSQTLLDHAKAQTDFFEKEFALSKDSFVVEVASNDGYLLQYFVQKGIPVLGIEPAKNIAAVANEKGIKTYDRFFNLELVQELTKAGPRADLLIGNNVLAHVPDIRPFLVGVQKMLKSTGVCSFEFPYLADMLQKNEFDTIYHEHVFYFSVTALDALFKSAGLHIFRVIQHPIHGGTLQILATPDTSRKDLNKADFLKEEQSSGLLEPQTLLEFQKRMEEVSKNLHNFLATEKSKGKKIAGYGAAAKATVLMNFAKIDTSLLDYVVDKNPYKQHRYVPGVSVPVEAPEKILGAHPDYLIIFPWNISKEIMLQQGDFLKKGGKCLVAIPTLKVIE